MRLQNLYNGIFKKKKIQFNGVCWLLFGVVSFRNKFFTRIEHTIPFLRGVFFPNSVQKHRRYAKKVCWKEVRQICIRLGDIYVASGCCDKGAAATRHISKESNLWIIFAMSLRLRPRRSCVTLGDYFFLPVCVHDSKRWRFQCIIQHVAKNFSISLHVIVSIFGVYQKINLLSERLV